MTDLAQQLQDLSTKVSTIGSDLDSIQQAKQDLTLVNKAYLKKIGLKPKDIANLPEVHRSNCDRPVYQIADVQDYLNTIKTKSTKSK